MAARFELLQSLFSRHRRRCPGALGGLFSRWSRFAMDAGWVLTLLGAPFRVRRGVDLFITAQVLALLVSPSVRMPLATVASTRLSFILLLSVGHRVHLNVDLQGTGSSEYQSVSRANTYHSKIHSEEKSQALVGSVVLSSGGTLLDPLGLSLLPVIPCSHCATVPSSTSSRWI